MLQATPVARAAAHTITIQNRAKRTLDRAERTRERIEGELEQATVAEKAARKELSSSESAHEKAKAECERLRRRVF